MRPGRPLSSSDELLSKADGSDMAKARAKAFLEVQRGEKTVEEACQSLGIGRSYFFSLKDEAVQGLVDGLEPKAPGRPPKAVPEDLEVRELKEKVKELEVRLQMAETRVEISERIPHVFQKKTTPPSRNPA